MPLHLAPTPVINWNNVRQDITDQIDLVKFLQTNIRSDHAPLSKSESNAVEIAIDPDTLALSILDRRHTSDSTSPKIIDLSKNLSGQELENDINRPNAPKLTENLNQFISEYLSQIKLLFLTSCATQDLEALHKFIKAFPATRYNPTLVNWVGRTLRNLDESDTIAFSNMWHKFGGNRWESAQAAYLSVAIDAFKDEKDPTKIGRINFPQVDKSFIQTGWEHYNSVSNLPLGNIVLNNNSDFSALIHTIMCHRGLGDSDKGLLDSQPKVYWDDDAYQMFLAHLAKIKDHFHMIDVKEALSHYTGLKVSDGHFLMTGKDLFGNSVSHMSLEQKLSISKDVCSPQKLFDLAGLTTSELSLLGRHDQVKADFISLLSDLDETQSPDGAYYLSDKQMTKLLALSDPTIVPLDQKDPYSSISDHFLTPNTIKTLSLTELKLTPESVKGAGAVLADRFINASVPSNQDHLARIYFNKEAFAKIGITSVDNFFELPPELETIRKRVLAKQAKESQQSANLEH